MNKLNKYLRLNKNILKAEGEIMYLITAIFLAIYLAISLSLLTIVKEHFQLNGIICELGRRMSIISSFKSFNNLKEVEEMFENEKKGMINNFTNKANDINNCSISKIDEIDSKDITFFRIENMNKQKRKIGFITFNPNFISYFVIRRKIEN